MPSLCRGSKERIKKSINRQHISYEIDTHRQTKNPRQASGMRVKILIIPLRRNKQCKGMLLI